MRESKTLEVLFPLCLMGSPGGSVVESACREGNKGSVPGLGRSPEEGYGYPHPGILAWRIPWTEEPGGLQSTRSQRVKHD